MKKRMTFSKRVMAILPKVTFPMETLLQKVFRTKTMLLSMKIARNRKRSISGRRMIMEGKKKVKLKMFSTVIKVMKGNRLMRTCLWIMREDS
jgi:hypothetical protein